MSSSRSISNPKWFLIRRAKSRLSDISQPIPATSQAPSTNPRGSRGCSLVEIPRRAGSRWRIARWLSVRASARPGGGCYALLALHATIATDRDLLLVSGRRIPLLRQPPRRRPFIRVLRHDVRRVDAKKLRTEERRRRRLLGERGGDPADPPTVAVSTAFVLTAQTGRCCSTCCAPTSKSHQPGAERSRHSCRSRAPFRRRIAA